MGLMTDSRKAADGEDGGDRKRTKEVDTKFR